MSSPLQALVKILFHLLDELPVINLPLQQGQEKAMINVVEVTGDIDIDQPPGSRPNFADFIQRCMTGASGSEAVRGFREDRLVNSFQQQPGDFLRQLIVSRLNPQWPSFAIGLVEIGSP